ncbi:MAG: GNAT family N-acetyltransferase [Eggerthellaceae bacterium]|nr:GNAT family N-acetyltransferase [Eggerthellaceae bacterium]
MLLRKAEIAEIDRILEILADGRRTLAEANINQWQGGYPQRDVIERDINSCESYVVEDEDGSLAATAMLSFRGEQDYSIIKDGAWLVDSPESAPCFAVIHRVAVDSQKKGKGAAGLILRGAEEIVYEKGFRSIRIDTHADNIPMQRLLEKEGYTHCGTIFVDHSGELSSARMAFEKLL